MSHYFTELAVDMRLSKAQARRLVALLESTWGEYASYCDAVGDKNGMVAFFTGPVQFINDFLDNMDYLSQPVVRQALLDVQAQGQVTIAQFDVPGAGDVWTHTFGKDGKYDFRKGGIRDLVKGHLPRRCIQKTA